MVYRKVILQFPRTPQAVQVLVLIIVFVKALVQMTEFNPSEDLEEWKRMKNENFRENIMILQKN